MTLTDRVRAWAPLGPVRDTFAALCDAFPAESATDLDAAARDADVLRWRDGDSGRGWFDVGRKAEEEKDNGNR